MSYAECDRLAMLMASDLENVDLEEVVIVYISAFAKENSEWLHFMG